MDYSLLLGIGRKKKRSEIENEIKSWRYMEDGVELTEKVYSISLIDYLQEFNLTKYMERMLKKIFKGGGDISSVDSEAYYKRFLNFVKRIIVVIKN